MSSLYTFSPDTKQKIRKFRLSGSRAKKISAEIYKIDPTSYELQYEDPDDIIDSLESLADELPDNSPRFVLMNYPYKSSDGRLVSPLVFLYYMPPTARQELKMLYAGCVEQMKDEVAPNEFIEVADEDDFDDLDDQIRTKWCK